MSAHDRIMIQVTPEQLRLIITAMRAAAIKLVEMAEEMADLKPPKETQS